MSVWHSMPPESVLAELETSHDRGLSTSQIQQRQETYGLNVLDRSKRQSLAVRFFNQLKDPMILVLLAAAIIPSSSLTGMNAPDKPPTLELAITPPFLTASFKRARAAVVP